MKYFAPKSHHMYALHVVLEELDLNFAYLASNSGSQQAYD